MEGDRRSTTTPAAPDGRRRRPGRLARRILVLVGVAVVAAAALVPLPYAAIGPGSALAVEDLVELGGTSPGDVDGDVLLTTVSLREELTAFALLEAWWDDAVDVEEREEVTPPDVDPDEYREAQRQLFLEAADVAAAAGLRAAGHEVEVVGSGARVVRTLPESAAADALRSGDVIVAVDGAPVELASDLVNALAERDVGDEVRLDLRRDGEEVERVVELISLGDSARAGLGVAVETVDLEIDLPLPFAIDQRRIGGPSAGLMVALTVYELATDADLLDGRTVAGTGTIDFDGDVGPIGGIEQKVVAARRAGAELFLTPEQHLDDARRAAGGELEVVAVGTLDEALAALGD